MRGYSDEDGSKGREPVDLGTVRYIRSTDKAMLVRLGANPTWIPLSVIHDDSELYEGSASPGDEARLVVYQWFAEKESLG